MVLDDSPPGTRSAFAQDGISEETSPGDAIGHEENAA